MVRSPRCAHAGAQPGSAAGSPGSAALAVARLAQRRGERPLGEGRRRGPPAAGSGQKIPPRGGLPSPQFPPPHTPSKLLPTFSGTFLHFQADKALSARRPGTGFLGRGKSLRKPRSAAWSSARSEPQKWWESPQAIEPLVWGCWASGLGDTSTSERMACPPMIPVFIFDLFFIL